MSQRRYNKIEKEHYLLAGAFFLLIALVVSYGYLLSATVVHVVMQKEVRQEINATHTEIAHLESEYITRQHAVSDEIASLQGFVVASNKIFINKSDTSLVLSSNN